MKHLKFAILALAALCFTNVVEAAPFRQQIKVCADVPGDLNKEFRIYFYSTDILDFVGHTAFVKAGVGCADFTYNEGPKRLYIELRETSARPDITLLAGSSCSSIGFHQDPSHIAMWTDTGRPHHCWSLVLTKTLDPKVLIVSCKTEAN